MNRITLAYIVIISSAVLLVLNMYFAFTESTVNYFAIISNVLIIIAMAIIIYNRKKNTFQP